MMKKLFLYLTALLTLGSVAIADKATEKFYASDDFFPIVAWGIQHSRNPDYYRKMKECGITLAGFIHPNRLDMVYNAGLKAYIYDSATQANQWLKPNEEKMRAGVEALVKKVNSHPVVFGYFITDEPHSKYFPSTAIMRKLIEELAPGKHPYTNLLPGGARKNQYGTNSYKEYVERFIVECKPQILSYDRYGLREGKTVHHDGFWENMRMFRKESIKHGIPFWFIGQTTACLGKAVPTEGSLSLVAYSAIAYGARGICWFTFHGVNRFGWYGAALDQFEEKTSTFRKLQYVNRTILNYAPLINHLNSDMVYHIGGVEPDIHPPTADSLIADIKPNGNFLVGEFTHDQTGARYVLIVNKDLARSNHCLIKWRKEPTGVYCQAPWGRYEFPWGGENLHFAPGGAIFLRLKPSLSSEGQVLSFPLDGWKFKTDPKDTGIRDSWATDTAHKGWETIRIDQSWTKQGHDYYGVAWYSIEFDLPGTRSMDTLALQFEAVDGYCKVFLDGKMIGKQSKAPNLMWKTPFAIPVKKMVSPGKHVLTVRVEKDRAAAGIWRPVSLVDISRQ